MAQKIRLVWYFLGSYQREIYSCERISIKNVREMGEGRPFEEFIEESVFGGDVDCQFISTS